MGYKNFMTEGGAKAPRLPLPSAYIHLSIIFMKVKSTLLALTVASLALAAAPKFSIGKTDAAPVSSEMQSRTVKHNALNAAAHFSSLPSQERRASKAVIRRGQGFVESEFDQIEQMGTLETVLEEDFSLLTTGSIGNPDYNTQLEMEWGDGKDYRYPYTNFNRNYTHVPEWGAGNCYPAGGCVYFYCAEGDQAKVNTPMLDLQSDGGIAVIEFKARCGDGKYEGILVETAETNGMGPTWNFYDRQPVMFGCTDKWETFRAVFIGAGPTTIFQIVGMAQGDLYIDDIKVYHMKPYAGIPQVLPHSGYDREGFTANWSAVPGAEHYLLNLWMVNADGTHDYLITDEKVTTNSFRAEGLEGDEWGYSVRSVNGNNISYESKEMGVYDIVAPYLLEPEIRGNQDFTGKWEELDLAAGYSYWVYNERTAKEDGEFIVTDEDFDDVATPEGEKTEFTIENPDDRTLDTWYPTELNQRGWKARHYAPYKGFICLDTWWYYQGVSDVCLLSPEMDFSKNGGKFTLSCSLAGQTVENPGYAEDSTQPQYVTAQACVALFNWNEELGDYEQVELVYLPENTPVRNQWGNFSFNLTKGGKRSIVGIFAIRGLDNLYLDNLLITQDYKAGESLIEPFYMHTWTYSAVADDAVSQQISIPDRATGGRILHKVNAVRAKISQNPYNGELMIDKMAEGPFSPLTEVMTTNEASVKALPSLKATASLEKGTLTVHNPREAEVKVYSIDGALVMTLGRKPVITGTLPAGAYIVTVGNTSFKVIG